MDKEPNNVEVKLKTQDEVKKTRASTLVWRTTVVVGIGLVIVAVAIVLLVIYKENVLSEQNREISRQSEENLLMRRENQDMERRSEEMIRETDGLNWTLRFIMRHDNFPVKIHCPQKVCQRCPVNWLPLQSKCYGFYESTYSSRWKTWQESIEYCKGLQAQLLVIESPEEQEFISKHAKSYHKDNRGYWMGLSNTQGSWRWIDESQVSLQYWTKEPGYSTSCAVILPKTDPRENWKKVSCNMRNNWICEKGAMIKPD